jgi:hypothetical protein
LFTNENPRLARESESGGHTDSDWIAGNEVEEIKTLKLTPIGYLFLPKTTYFMND